MSKRVWGLGTAGCMALGVVTASAQPQGPAPDAAAAVAAPEDARLSEADRLTGASLDYLERRRLLQQAMRDLVAGPDREVRALNEAIAVLDATARDPEGEAAALSRLALIERERVQAERWLWGEEAPDEPGLTRAALEDRLRFIDTQLRHATRLIRAYAAEDAAERSRLRGEWMALVEAQREAVKRVTRPALEQLEALDASAVELAGPFEAAMSAFGRVGEVGPVVVAASEAGAWFKDRMVAYRWMDADGRLLATAQVRLRPSADTDPEPPLLLGRFAIDAHTDQEARVSVGHFAIVFRITVPELEGEPQVLDALTRLLDLEALSRVRPMLGEASQN